MIITAEELSAFLSANKNSPDELNVLKERVVKLESLTKELLDLLTDFRVNQIMKTEE